MTAGADLSWLVDPRSGRMAQHSSVSGSLQSYAGLTAGLRLGAVCKVELMTAEGLVHFECERSVANRLREIGHRSRSGQYIIQQRLKPAPLEHETDQSSLLYPAVFPLAPHLTQPAQSLSLIHPSPASNSQMDLRVGGKYRIGKKIGSGSFGKLDSLRTSLVALSDVADSVPLGDDQVTSTSA